MMLSASESGSVPISTAAMKGAMDTIFDAVIASLSKASVFNKDDVVPPAAVLWTDERREFERLLPRLRLTIPNVLTLGPYDPATRTGPAIWLRCVLAGRLAEFPLPPDTIPVLYLPGVSRPTMRATDDCLPELRSLAELQYRGVFWSQHNGKDWTVSAFLQSEKGGLSLRIARDPATQEALRRSVEKLMDVPVADLAAKSAVVPLDTHDFDALVVDDLVDDLLTWIADPVRVLARWQSEPGRWETLRSRCKGDYGFDPEKDGELAGAELLGLQAKPAWKQAWKRFAASPSRYPGLADMLRKAKPRTKGGDLLANLAVESWPQDNDAEEASLRRALHDLEKLAVPAARKRLLELDDDHRARRDWAWAKLGRASLANSLVHLKTLAEATNSSPKGATTDEVIQAYVSHGWIADLAVLDALASVSTQDDKVALSTATKHIYTPWLRDLARTLPGTSEARAAGGSRASPAQGRDPGHLRLLRGRVAVRPGAAPQESPHREGSLRPASPSHRRIADRHPHRQARHLARRLRDRRSDGGRGVPPLRRPIREGTDDRQIPEAPGRRWLSDPRGARDRQARGAWMDRIRQPRSDRASGRVEPGASDRGIDRGDWRNVSWGFWRRAGRRFGSSPTTAGSWSPAGCPRRTCPST